MNPGTRRTLRWTRAAIAYFSCCLILSLLTPSAPPRQLNRWAFMRTPRQIRMLCQLADGEFFSSIAEGVNLVIENAQTYRRAAAILAKDSPGRAVEHLRLTAEEEAAKVLILLDAVRCPRGNDNEQCRSRTLGYFIDHLPRGIYAWYACNRPGTFEEAAEIVEAARQSYYDGPDGNEFECRNWILSQREENQYVDYVQDDGKCYWTTPNDMDAVIGQHVGHSMVLDLAESLWRLGCGTKEGIRIVAETWRPIIVSDSVSDAFEWLKYKHNNNNMLDSLQKAGLTEGARESDWDVVIDGWGYPLYSLDLTDPNRKVRKSSDKAQQIVGLLVE